MDWKIGHGKAEITPKSRGISMMGYGMPHNKVLGVETPIWARTLFVKTLDSRALLINLEICFISDSIRQGVMNRLRQLAGWDSVRDEEVMLMAQHTHSAPSGYGHFAFYNIPTPGFVPEVLESYLGGIIKSIEMAISNLQPCTIKFGKSDFDAELPVVFNRSIPTYKENFEVSQENLATEPAMAIDRFMYLFSFSNGGRQVASANWFGVHSTSVPNYNTKINADNKGYAAHFLEKQMEALYSEHTGLFGQTSAADTTPNFIWDKARKQYRGQFEDFLESAKFNGKLQAQKAIEIIENKNQEMTKVEPFLKATFRFVDMSNVVASKEFIPMKYNVDVPKTSSPSFGVSFIIGTDEGPGASKIIGFFVAVVSTIVRFFHILKSYHAGEKEKKEVWDYYNSQNPKHVFVDSGNRKILGFGDPTKIPVPDFVDPLLKTMRSFYRNGSMREHSWSQKIMPVQLLLLGHVAIVGLPGEVTTISALRIRRQVLKRLEKMNITEVIISGYTNGYCGYLTTPEEYDTQNYEAGHTVFGKWTLPAFQTVIDDLCFELLGETRENKTQAARPVQFSDEELAGRTTNPKSL